MFIGTLFTIAKLRKLMCLRTDEWVRKMCIYTMEYYTALKRTFAICNNMDRFGRNNANSKLESKYQMVSLT